MLRKLIVTILFITFVETQNIVIIKPDIAAPCSLINSHNFPGIVLISSEG